MNPRTHTSLPSSRSADAAEPLVPLRDLVREGRIDPTSVEARAAALIQRIPKPPPLASSAYLRIEDEILQRTTPQVPRMLWLRRLGWGAAALSTVTASFLLGLSMRPARIETRDTAPLAASRSLELHEVRLPRDSQARLSVGTGDQLTVEGPGTLSLQGMQVTFRQGRLRVDSGNQPLLITIGSRRVTVGARSSASLSAHVGELVLVAAYVGSVTIGEPATDGSLQTFTVPAGSSWTAAPVADPRSAAVGTPAHESPQMAPQRAAVRAQRGNATVPNKTSVHAAVSGALTAPQPTLTTAPSRLLAESQLLGRALQRLHRERDARGALSVLDEYATQYADGTLRAEASAARVDALLQLDRRSEALQILDGASFSNLARGGELRLLRGELRAHAGRCREAVADFDAALRGDARSDGPLTERALYGVATCRLQLGERGMARDALRKYLSLYPTGRFADAAREALGQL
ncbi:MAG: tetratricopeptide repeat protein [Myxococcales bacterium]|nr:tetratricopeptide repeat protein [Myxococcales bacterium]